MEHFFREAFFIGAREGGKLVLCAYLVFSLFKVNTLHYLKKPLAGGIFAAFLVSFAALGLQAVPETRDIIVKMIGYVFGIFYLFSLGALFQSAGTDVLGPLNALFRKKTFLSFLVFLLTILYFVPDVAASSLYVADLFAMSGTRYAIPLSAGAGFALSSALFFLLVRKVRIDFMRLFGLPQVLLFLALIKLVAGDVHGFAEFPLILSVQAGLMKLVHDVVHQTLILMLIPDHPLLTMTAWKFIGFLFSDTLAVWLALVIIALPLVFFIKKHFAEKVDVPKELGTNAVRRIFLKSIRDDRVLKSVPVFLFLLVVVNTWFVERGESLSEIYNPAPTPVVAEGGRVSIPIHTVTEDLLDGRIHKFALTVDGKVARLLLMKRSDGTISACLDACEICPPEGYAQVKERVVCLYCKTPIPPDTLGRPGGCNPVPLNALVTERDVRIDVAEIAGKWSLIKSGKKEGADK